VVNDALLDAFLDELAERVATRLSTNGKSSDAPADPWRLWTLAETAERLTRSERWVREKAKTGELASIRLDGGRAALAFDPADVRAFARKRRIGDDLEQPADGAEWWE
jgi:hypothetical protein